MAYEIKHSTITGNLSHRTFKYQQATDPRLEPGNTVAADDWWLDYSTQKLKVSNDANDGWLTI